LKSNIAYLEVHIFKQRNGGEAMEDVEKKVTKFIQGKHGMIGIIAPEKPPTEKEWNELHRAIAEIVINSKEKGNEEAAS
jgi:hypothetical protein